MGKRILKVFPRKTKATPDDEYTIINRMPELLDYADEIQISVSFSYDLPRAEKLYKMWCGVAPCTIGGPATGMAGEDFIPGKYLKQGYVITSRGCNNKCWFCSVPIREGKIKELPITEGYNVLDDNLFACSEEHIQNVFAMLKRQAKAPKFTGGLEAKLLTFERAKQLRELNPRSMFFAYDTPDDLKYIKIAGEILQEVGFTKASHVLRSYILVGYPKDTFEKALKRIHQTWAAGFMPMTMLYRNEDGVRDMAWIKFNTEWANPTKCASNLNKIN